MKQIFAALLLFTTALSSCKKYDDGPFVSVHTKAHRLVGTWFVHAESEDGVDKTTDFETLYQGYTVIITREGTYARTYAVNGIFNYDEVGTWDWGSKNEHVLFTKSSSNSVTDWELLELKEKEMKVRYTDYTSNPNKVVEITFTSGN